MKQKSSMLFTVILLCWGAAIAGINQQKSPSGFNDPMEREHRPTEAAQASAFKNPLDAVTFTYEGSTLYNGTAAKW